MTADLRVDAAARALHHQREQRTAHLPNYQHAYWEHTTDTVREHMREQAREIVAAIDAATNAPPPPLEETD